ncbi:transposase domain-containing protein [Pseudaestuariivita sp.]|uniref:transposase domain-containing protein n=1 Tax=Pseudaestuariivita sp. TaxID=2211669 RepID=UPI004059AF5F
MTALVQKEWWSVPEIIDAKLPDFPNTERGILKLIERSRWRNTDFARKRAARGAGWEYHWTLFPQYAQNHLIRAVHTKPDAVPQEEDRTAKWAAYEQLPAKHQEKAQYRADVLDRFHKLVQGGMTKFEAAHEAGKMSSCSARSIWNWLDMVYAVPREDWLPCLAPSYAKGARPRVKTPIDPDFVDLVKSDWLRLAGPSFTTSYERARRIAEHRGIPTVPVHTMRRWIKANVSKETETFLRKGEDALKRLYPAQTRDKTAMTAMEGVNGDFHRFDVFVRFPGGPGQAEEIGRPQMVAFQDIFSGRLLSWRVDRTANSHAVQLCLGDLIEDWGIPNHVLLDNGREFAAKAITGGTPTRFRFKVRDDDIPGLLTSLGCKVHWATPYSGQSKPIERAFRDLCDSVAKHPAFEGAYTGNSPTAKPEDYGTRAVPLEQFLAVLSEEIERHNMRRDRRTETAYGRSFAEVFDESYASAPITKATPAQRRLWLLGAEGVRAHSRTGQISFMGNKYYAPWMLEIAGEKVVARFDRADLWAGLHIYDLTGEYRGHAVCQAKAGFFDVEEGRAHAKARGDWMKAERAAARAHRKLTAAELGEALAEAALPQAEAPEPKVVRIATTPRPEPKPVVDAGIEAKQAELIEDFETRKLAHVQRQDDEDERDLARRAFDIEARLERGEELTRDQRKWLNSFQRTPTYKAMKAMVESFGETALRK